VNDDEFRLRMHDLPASAGLLEESAGGDLVASVGARVRRRTRRLLATGVAAVTLVAGGTAGALAVSHSSGVDRVVTTSPGPAGALACPRKVPRLRLLSGGYATVTVPHTPVGVPTDRLVPLHDPISAVVCTYGSEGLFPHRRVLKSDLGELASILTWVPPFDAVHSICSMNSVSVPKAPARILLGLRYAHGQEWVASEDGYPCELGSNGRFITADMDDALASYAATGNPPGPLPRRPGKVSSPSCAPVGRYGQQARMVPAGARSLTICGVGRAVVVHRPFSALIAALNRSRAFAGASGCTSFGRSATVDILVFGHRVGPTLGITVSRGCQQPPIQNGYLAADDPGGRVFALVQRYLAHPGA